MNDTQHSREGSAGVDRQYGVGVTYTAGNLYVAGIVQQTNVASNWDTTREDLDDPLTVSLGGNYDFGVAKLFVATQYFKDSSLYQDALQSTRVSGHNYGYAYDGFGMTVGADVPLFGGTAKALVGYMTAEDQNTTAATAQTSTAMPSLLAMNIRLKSAHSSTLALPTGLTAMTRPPRAPTTSLAPSPLTLISSTTSNLDHRWRVTS